MKSFFLITAVVIVITTRMIIEAIDELRCDKVYSQAYVSQMDEYGRKCFDNITVKSCMGKCDSNEVGDFKFPFKKSWHPVCVHTSVEPASAILNYCDPLVTPGTNIYHFVNAQSCACQICSSKNTSCEWLPPDLPRILSKNREDIILSFFN